MSSLTRRLRLRINRSALIPRIVKMASAPTTPPAMAAACGLWLELELLPEAWPALTGGLDVGVEVVLRPVDGTSDVKVEVTLGLGRILSTLGMIC
jgi:hypothetical protein